MKNDPIPRSDFDALVREHHAAVFRSAMRILRNEEDAADVTQQVFVRVLEGKERLSEARDPGRVLRWLAAKSALASARERDTRRRKESESAMNTHEADPADPSREPSNEEQQGALRRFLHALPEELRCALVLRFQEEMTYADIAESQGCSEPTAHERVQKGLERLRFDLSRAGLAGVVAALPTHLAQPEPFAVPAQLQAKLLALSAKGAAVAAGAGSHGIAMAAAALLAVATIGGSLLLLHDGAASPAAASRLASPAPAARGEALADAGTGRATREPAAGRTDESATAGSAAPGARTDRPRGTIVGRLVDETGGALADVRVEAESLERQGKVFAIGAVKTSGPDGRFAVEVELHVADGQDFRVTTESPDLVRHEIPRLKVRPNATTDVGTIELHANSGDRPGNYSLAVRVTGPAGEPVPRAEVRVFRRVKGEDGVWHRTMEDDAPTGATGSVELHGTRLGEKTLEVDATSSGLRRSTAELVVDSEGLHAHDVVLAPGLSIRGVLVGLDRSMPNAIHHLSCWAEEGEPWLQATIDDAGRFAFVGLDDRPYTLFLSSRAYSPVKLEGVRPDGGELSIALKRWTDAIDHGDHMAEIHGRVRDARTGEPVPVDDFDLECLAVPALAPADHARDTLPNLIQMRPVQRLESLNDPPPTAEFHCAGLEPGTYVVAVRKAGYGPGFSAPVTVDRGEIRSDVVIALPGAGAISGAVLDPDGKPLAGAVVAITGSGEQSSKFVADLDANVEKGSGLGFLGGGCYVRNDAQGRFRFDRLPPGLVLRLAVFHPRFEPSMSGSVRLKEGEARIDVELHAGRARAR